jgi:5'-nucleotidase
MSPAVAVELDSARLLLSNDDGIAAPGLRALEHIAKALAKDIWIVAPELEQSGAGHSLTMRRPLRIRQLGRRRYAVDGTPTDSVLLAVNHILKKHRPDLILSGVNRGGNLGEDVTYSGTIAAAMEGTLLTVPAVALSLQTTPGRPIHWKTAEIHGPDVIRKLAAAGWPANVMINVNFPDCAPDEVKGVRVARQGRRKIGDELAQREDLRGEHYYWIGPMRQERSIVPGSDIAAVQERYISVTPLNLDLTDEPTSQSLAKVFP